MPSLCSLEVQLLVFHVGKDELPRGVVIGARASGSPKTEGDDKVWNEWKTQTETAGRQLFARPADFRCSECQETATRSDILDLTDSIMQHVAGFIF